MAETQKHAPLALEICAIDRVPYRREAEAISLPGEYGLFMVLPGHAPLVATLEVGVLTARTGNEERRFSINGGVARVFENHVLVLTRTAEADADIDRDRAEASRKRAEERLRSQREKIDVARAEAALRRALARLRAGGQAFAGASPTHE